MIATNTPLSGVQPRRRSSGLGPIASGRDETGENRRRSRIGRFGDDRSQFERQPMFELNMVSSQKNRPMKNAFMTHSP